MRAGCIPGICINALDADPADKARSVQSGEFEVFQQEDRDFERADMGICGKIALVQHIAHNPNSKDPDYLTIGRVSQEIWINKCSL